MAGVSTFLKCAITLAVVFGILYVLISPLPEMDADFSGKSAITYFILVTQALLGLYFLTLLMRFRPIDWNATAHGDVLKMICVRLC
jgi:Na+/citrate or Na+/malate symporter